MDRIDFNLAEAWNRVSTRVRADRVEALRRAGRLGTVNVREPIRAWCLCLRASDTRLTSMNCIVEPIIRDEWDSLGPDEGTDTIIASHRPHMLTVPGGVIRTLMQPVTIPWPGEDWKRVAEKCGVTKFMLVNWIRNGQIRIEYRVPARTVGGRGRRVPLVYTPSPIDPNAFDARPPQMLWGSAWQGMWERIPEEFEQKAERVPRHRMLNGRQVFRGWTWVCPGRVGRNGEYMGCGRTCNRLFGPLRPWTIPQALNDRLDIEMAADSGLAGAWSPGFTDPEHGRRSFACKRCWGVRDVSLLGPDGWNVFVTHLTGGLLYGHEVERPEDEAPQIRRRRYSKRRGRPAVRREQVRRLILEGLSYAEIGERLGIATATAASTARLVYRDAGVRRRAQFMSKCGVGNRSLRLA
jgi:DNA-binding CsgD family transcriptional regulator